MFEISKQEPVSTSQAIFILIQILSSKIFLFLESISKTKNREKPPSRDDIKFHLSVYQIISLTYYHNVINHNHIRERLF